MEDVSRAVQGGVRPTISPFSPPLYVSLMESCWETNPDARPTFADVVDHLVDLVNMLGLQSEAERVTQV